MSPLGFRGTLLAACSTAVQGSPSSVELFKLRRLPSPHIGVDALRLSRPGGLSCLLKLNPDADSPLSASPRNWASCNSRREREQWLQSVMNAWGSCRDQGDSYGLFRDAQHCIFIVDCVIFTVDLQLSSSSSIRPGCWHKKSTQGCSSSITVHFVVNMGSRRGLSRAVAHTGKSFGCYASQ